MDIAIPVTVNLDRLSKFHKEIARVRHVQSNNEVDTTSVTFSIDLQSGKETELSFKKSYNLLLKQLLVGKDQQNVHDELLYLSSICKTIWTEVPFDFKGRENAKMQLIMLIELIEGVNFVTEESKLHLTIYDGSRPKVLPLPQSTNTKELFTKLTDTVLDYVQIHTPNFHLWGLIGLYKDKHSLSRLKKIKESLSNDKHNDTNNHNIAVCADLILKYTREVGQIKQNAGAVISGPEVDFVYSYLHLFGLLGQSHRIDLTTASVRLLPAFHNRLLDNLKLLDAFYKK